MPLAKPAGPLAAAWRRLDGNLRRRMRRWLARPMPRHLLRDWSLRHMDGLAVNVGDTNDNFFRLGWHTLDHCAPADFLADLTQEDLPLPAGSVRAFHASHILEHLDDAQAARLLAGMHRALEPGGLLRLAVPDLPRHIAEYRRDPAFAYFYQREDRPGHTVRQGLERAIARGSQGAWALEPHNALFSVVVSYTNGRFLHQVARDELERRLEGPLEDLVRWCVSHKKRGKPDFGHVNGYDHARLTRLLEAAGFRSCRPSRYRDPDSHPLFRGLDRQEKASISIYIDAER